MTRIETAALGLSKFLRNNCPPPDIAGTKGEVEWPVSITASEESAMELAFLLSEQESALVDAGYMTRERS